MAEELVCPWCRTGFEPKRRDQSYCCTACNDAAFKLMLKRAVRIYRALYHWRFWHAGEGRLGVGANFKFICGEIASWIREDRDAQRPPPPPHDHESDRGHQRERKPVTLKPAARRAA